MLLNEKDKAYLWDIIEACKDIISFIDGLLFEDFSKNKIVRYAVERQIIVIGEAEIFYQRIS